jgi:TonB-linked SusC/RagA family outer membrane protein
MEKLCKYFWLLRPNCKFYQIQLKMKLTTLLIFTGILNALAGPTYSQTARINLNLKNVKIETVLNEIEKKSDYYFLLNQKLVDVSRVVSVSVENTPIKDLLAKMFEGENVDFFVYDRQIILTPKMESFNKGSMQLNKVTGVVKDAMTNEPIIGANILIEGTTIGAVSDVDGRYSIDVQNNNTVLVVSFIGYNSERVVTNGQTVLDFNLVPDIKKLDEIVVIGYGVSKRKDLTGSISSIKASEIQGISATSAEALLQGKAAGVQIIQNSGTPGGDVFVRVRGSGSLMGESRPLYVVDGIPMNNVTSQFIDGGGQASSGIASINPNDIENIEILKDASSTAIYGSRGSNGVVLITTKKGKSGNAKFNFSSSYGLQSTPKKLELINGQDFVSLVREELTNVNRNPDVFPYNEMVVSPVSTNWQDAIFRTAPVADYNFSVTGGNEKLSAFLSMGYHNQEGTIIEQQYKRYTGRLNVDYQAMKRLKIGMNVSSSFSENNKVPNDYSTYSVLANALLIDPNVPVYNEDGTYGKDRLLTRENPVLMAKEITYDSHQKRLIANMYAELSILEGLKFKSTFGVDNASTREERFVPSFVLFRRGNAEATALNQEVLTVVNENTLNYLKTIGEHSFTLLGGLSFQESKSSWLSTGGQTAGSDLITTIAITNPYIPSHSLSSWGLLSYFGRVNYNFRDRYLADASFRVDGSSRFGENKRYGTFPSASVAWRVSNESFLTGIKWITDLKLRASIGATGNQDGLPDFPSLALYGSGRNYDGMPGISQNNIANIDLGWESTVQTNVGIDVTLFDGRVSFFADLYNKKTTDLIFPRDIPWHTGFSRIDRVNLGNMTNKGLELSLSTKNFAGKFKWNTDFNISFNKNEITSLPDNGPSGSDFIYKANDSQGAEGPYLIYRVGEPIGSFYGFKFNGVYANDSDVPRTPVDAGGKNLYDKGVRGGDAIYEDVNQDGSILRANDRLIIGNALPKHTGGITNTFSYKGLDLSVFMNWSYGNDIYNMTRAVLEAMAVENNQSVTTLNRWKTQGQITNVPRAWYGASAVGGAANTDVSSRFLEDGSFLRLRSVTLGYQFPTSLIEKFKITSLRVYVTGQNLYTFTNYSGYDPESQNIGNSVTQPTLGVDYLTQPLPRIVMFGLNIGF